MLRFATRVILASVLAVCILRRWHIFCLLLAGAWGVVREVSVCRRLVFCLTPTAAYLHRLVAVLRQSLLTMHVLILFVRGGRLLPPPSHTTLVCLCVCLCNVRSLGYHHHVVCVLAVSNCGMWASACSDNKLCMYQQTLWLLRCSRLTWWDWSIILSTLSSFSALTLLVGSFDPWKPVPDMTIVCWWDVEPTQPNPTLLFSLGRYCNCTVTR